MKVYRVSEVWPDGDRYNSASTRDGSSKQIVFHSENRALDYMMEREYKIADNAASYALYGNEPSNTPTYKLEVITIADA